MTVTAIVPLIYVADADRSLAFYAGLLGFELVQRTAPDAGYFWGQLESGSARLMINSVGDDLGSKTATLPDDFGCVLYLAVDDVHALHRHLVAGGLTVSAPTTQDYGLDQLWLRDPDGYQLCCTSPSNGRDEA